MNPGDGDGENPGDGDGENPGDGSGDGDGNGDGDPSVEPSHSYVYMGGWDWSNGAVYPFRVYELDRTSGNLSQVGGDLDFGENPGFIMPSKDGRFLYIGNEKDGNAGGVTVAEIDRSTGVPSRIDSESTGSAFVYTSLDPAGKYLLAASYSQGEASVFPVNDDGSLDAAVDTEDLGGNAHSIRVTASGKWAFVPNLAENVIEQLAFDENTGALSPNPAGGSIAASGGPRHIALHPDGEHAFVMFEKAPKLVSYRILENGTLEEVEEERTVPEGENEQAGAHVLLHPSGDTLYVSNRDQKTIAVFRVASDGTLTFLEHTDTRGVHPRNFDIDATGKFMVVANKGNDGSTNQGSLTVFSIGTDGLLSPIGEPVTGLREPTGVAIVNVP